MLLRLSGADVSLAKPPQHYKKWNQGKREKEWAAAPVDQAVYHLRPYIHAKKPDHKNAKSIP